MARVEGFEPPTAWFVARYSIQLSYASAKEWRLGRDSNPRYGYKPYTPLAGERLQPLGHLTVLFPGKEIMARPGGFEPPTAWFVARYSIQLS